ncbi:hypothetical protein PP175_13645 [Aneurinibacillus sp. Ricciae_BoGa-3]|uniref:hypothetical protein n=1 Tax=Aneurinibacillus sp. Ricciae_BoGa-3 TaxID=3022697 RepID=UPI00233FA9D6|nr:hypothetical protein [Aneurinibacillus sp. Ricciae_BoGa-3]WCK52495.1 hypothetical protein PP175_13645 [Aneurinibacillus sp. Ricciae_BoGa-3]
MKTVQRTSFRVYDEVTHKVFGQGIIESIDGDVLKISFADCLRTMSLKAMLKIKVIKK